MRSLFVIGGVVVTIAVVALGWAVHSQREGRGTTSGAPHSASSSRLVVDDGLPPADARPYEEVATDEPGGPEHPVAFDSRPTPELLAEAAGGAADRRAGEDFAVVFFAAMRDLTGTDRREEVAAYLADDAHPEATAWVQTRGYAGSSVVPSPQPAFIRSATVAGPDPLVLQVQLVALVHDPVLDLTFWQMARIEVRHRDGGWEVLDYQPTPVSERVEFSQPVWENVMDAGESWRRFEVVDRGLD